MGRENEIAELREELATRLLYTDIKMERGLVNYGSTNDRLANQYALLKSRSMAAVETMKNEKEGDENKTENIAMERLESFLEMKNDKAHAHVRRAGCVELIWAPVSLCSAMKSAARFPDFQELKMPWNFSNILLISGTRRLRAVVLCRE